MSKDNKNIRLSKVAREFNVGISSIVEVLNKKGIETSSNPNTKISEDSYGILAKEFRSDVNLKNESKKVNLKSTRGKKSPATIDGSDKEESPSKNVEKAESVKVSAPKISDKKNSETVDKKTKTVTKEKPIKNIDVTKELDKTNKPANSKKESSKKEVSKNIKKDNPVAEKAKEETKKEVESKNTKESANVASTESNGTPKVIGKIDLDSLNQKTRPTKKTRAEKDKERKTKSESPKTNKSEEFNSKNDSKDKGGDEIFKSSTQKLTGPTVIGKIELPVEKKSSSQDANKKRKKRKRIRKDNDRVNVSQNKPGGTNTTAANSTDRKKPGQGGVNRPAGNRPGFRPGGPGRPGGNRPAGNRNFNKGKKGKVVKKEITEEDVQKQIKDTLARLTSKGKSKSSRHRKDKRDTASIKQQEIENKIEAEKHTLKLTEFVSVNELANMMETPVTDIISTCMGLGLFVSINQRLDAETLAVVADEFGYKAEFVSVDIQEAIVEETDNEEDLITRPPIITVMGHVDHGKTSLLDFIRRANVIAGEAGGITQHIGAYNVTLKDGKKVTFLDTPGHEAFTAMRARGAQVTDIAIIIISADDNVMPQTIEAINHASAAGVPIVFAINKIDKDGADPERIKSELANMNYLVEDWGGKYQCQEISAKNGVNIDELMEKVMLESEMLELRANPKKRATGSIIESSLDKGRGYVATVLVHSGTLNISDIMLAGSYTGHVKAMFNERGQRITKVGPSEPALILGLNGAPQAGDNFNIMDNEKEARDIATKRNQLQREQGLRSQKHITLDEIGRRIAIGNFQELNVIVKGDVDGSIEALSDSLIKLSTEEIQVNVIHKAVGQISESDVLLATASNAIIIGFQVRPSLGARKLAEKEEIDVRLYSIIYDAIEELKSAMEGMLSPEIKEEITSNVEVIETFKISKVGTIAGCLVREGKIKRNNNIRIIRDGVVVHTGQLGSLKRFKDDVKEVSKGYECGLNIEKYNDIKVGDIVESYEETEVKKKL